MPVLHQTAGKINPSRVALDTGHGRPHILVMNYILALLLPPLSIIVAGRPFLGVLVFVIWIPALLFTGGLSHPMFILLAWFIIFSQENKKVRRE